MEQNGTRTPRSRVYARKPHLWRRTARGIFYIVWTEEGQTRKVSTRSNQRAVAEAALDEFEKHISNPATQQHPITMREAIEQWLEDKERPRQGLSTTTVRGYRSWAKLFCASFPRDVLAKDVTPAMLRAFLNRQEDAGLKGYTLRKQLGGLSMVFEFLIREGHLIRNPCKAIQIRAQATRHPEMTEQEHEALRTVFVEELQQARDPQVMQNAQDLLDLADILWNSGLRFIEATRLTWADVQLDKAMWTIRSPRNKGGITTLPMHPNNVTILSRRHQAGCETPLPGYWPLERLWQAFKKRHPLFAGWSWHRMRHAFVTRLRRAGRDAAARALARHSSALMSDHYTHLNLDDLRKDLESV